MHGMTVGCPFECLVIYVMGTMSLLRALCYLALQIVLSRKLVTHRSELS